MKQITRKLIEVGLAAIFSCSPLVAATTNNVAAATIRKANSKKKVKTRAVAKAKKAKFGKKGVSVEQTAHWADGDDASDDVAPPNPSQYPDLYTNEDQYDQWWLQIHRYYMVINEPGYGNAEDAPSITYLVERGDRTRRPPDPVRPGWDFDGWYTLDGVPYDFGLPIMNNLTLIGHWIPKA